MHKGICPVSVRNAGWRGKRFLDTRYTTRVAGGNLLSAQHLTHGFHDLAVLVESVERMRGKERIIRRCCQFNAEETS